MIDVIYRYDPNGEPLLPAQATPAEARKRLCDGNREFGSLDDLAFQGLSSTHIIPVDLFDFGIGETAGVAPRQQPFAVVLGCSDARRVRRR